MKRPTILVADDDRGIRSILRKRLESWGFAVREAPDGLAVLGSAMQKGVDAIILDHEMPNGDGRTVARIVRRECDAPIIFFSGHDRQEFRQAVFELPNVFFLPKPLNEKRLQELLGSCMPATSAVA